MNPAKSRILAHSPSPIERLARHRWLAAGIGALSLLGMVTAFATAPSTDSSQVPLQTVLEQLAPQASVIATPENAIFLREEIVQRSDTLANLLSRLGITEREALDFLTQNAATKAVSRQLRPGKAVAAKTSENGELHALYFPLNGQDATLVVERTEKGFAASQQALRLDTQTVVRSGEIRSSLFAATDAAGIPDAVATQLAEIFGTEIDFHRDLRKGDRFALVYEVLTHQGQPVRSGRIISAEFTNGSRTHQAYWFEGQDRRGAYYTADGKSLRKAFLRSPLEFSRITSGFTSARFHPVLQTWRAHKGVDYGAPIGTRVRAVADGTVEFAGTQSGYGNIIILKHQGTYSTAYGHLNGFGPGIRRGSRVSQGDTIGYVGQTGLASGPHLHYEFRVSNQQVNPLALNLPTSMPLEAQQLPRFRTHITALRSQLRLVGQVAVAAVD